MICHVLRVKGLGVPVCQEKFSPSLHKQYMFLLKKGQVKADSRKQASNDVVESVDAIQQSVALSL